MSLLYLTIVTNNCKVKRWVLFIQYCKMVSINIQFKSFFPKGNIRARLPGQICGRNLLARILITFTLIRGKSTCRQYHWIPSLLATELNKVDKSIQQLQVCPTTITNLATSCSCTTVTGIDINFNSYFFLLTNNSLPFSNILS